MKAGHHPLRVVLVSEKISLYHELKKHLELVCDELLHVIDPGESPPTCDICFIDRSFPNLEKTVSQEGLQGAYTVLIEDEKNLMNDVPKELSVGMVDDLLLLPVRPLELLGKIKHGTYIARTFDVLEFSNDLKTLVRSIEEDLKTARMIQKSLIPEKFPPLYGFKVSHKYLSGFKSGGDYLDFFEFEDKTHVGVLMTDSSGYGLSSAFLSVILRLTLRSLKAGSNSPQSMVEKIFSELKITMKPKENLSIFLGILNRKTFELVYSNSGDISFAAQNERGVDHEAHGGPKLSKDQTSVCADRRVRMNAGDRLVLMTDGFRETFRDEKSFSNALEKAMQDDPVELINQLTFQVKSKFEAEDDMPEQDCSVLVLDIEKRAMRLAT